MFVKEKTKAMLAEMYDSEILVNLSVEVINNAFGGYVLDYTFDNSVKDIRIYIREAIDCHMELSCQMWELMKHYQNPEDACLEDAIEDYIKDILYVIQETVISKKEEKK